MGLFDKLFGGKKNNTAISENNKVAISHYDKDGIYAIYDISLALSCLVTNAGDSWVSAVLQDENVDKGWPSLMKISAYIDNWRLQQKGITNLHCVDSYRKMEVPEDVAQFLASIPFKAAGGNLEYDFPRFPKWPSSCAAGILESMEKGSRMSRYASVREIKIENKPFGVQCKVD